MKPIHVNNDPRAGNIVDAGDRGIVKSPVGDPMVAVVFRVTSGPGQLIDELIEEISVYDHGDTVIGVSVAALDIQHDLLRPLKKQLFRLRWAIVPATTTQSLRQLEIRESLIEVASIRAG